MRLVLLKRVDGAFQYIKLRTFHVDLDDIGSSISLQQQFIDGKAFYLDTLIRINKIFGAFNICIPVTLVGIIGKNDLFFMIGDRKGEDGNILVLNKFFVEFC